MNPPPDLNGMRSGASGGQPVVGPGAQPTFEPDAEPFFDPGAQPVFDPDLLRALTGMDASASLAVAQRTRRAVRDAALHLRQDRHRRRRNKGLALLVAAGFLTLLTPALWSGMDEFFAGEHISDLQTMVTLTALTLFSAVVAALLASGKNHQHER